MRTMMCSICKDKRNFENKIAQAKNIVRRLEYIADSYEPFELDYRQRNFMAGLRNMCCYVHFMCGQCVNANEQKLRDFEREMDEYLVIIAENVKTTDSKYHETLRLLTGTYSGKYRLLEKYVHEKERREAP